MNNGQTLLTTDRATGFAYTAPPVHTALRVIGVLLITAIVVAVVVVVGFVALLGSSLGGIPYQPTDWTVRNARQSADSVARRDMEIVATRFTPVLGQPTRRATLDYCYDTGAAWSFNNDIACKRLLYLYYALDAPATAETSSSVSSLSAKCLPAEGPKTPCLSTSGPEVRTYVDYPAATSDPDPSETENLVEMDGYRELQFAASTGHNVVVVYAVTYFEG